MLLLSGLAMGCLWVLSPTQSSKALHRYWPQFPKPETVVTVRDVRSVPESFILQSVSGLAARAALAGRSREMIWYPIGHPAYAKWHEEMLRHTGAREVVLPDVWAAVERFRRSGIVKGYVLFREDRSERSLHEGGPYEPSPNAATVVAGQLGGILVSEGLEARAREMGLPRLADARQITEEECFERWGGRCSRRVLAMLDPKTAHCRAEAIAMNAFVVATYGPLLEKALARLEPDSPVLGWGMGDEFRLTEPISRWAAWQSATNWCLNLPALATQDPVRTLSPAWFGPPRPKTVWDLEWCDDRHYAAFLMTDGDNVQWLMGDFQEGAERSWWNSPVRGAFPMGWGTCAVDLAQLCPYALRSLFRTTTPSDDLVLMGGGYYYPDLFGSSRGGIEALRTHARRLRPYMRMFGMRLLHMNASRWDSEEAVRVYTALAEEIPELEGILMVQYAPYSAGQGRILWVKRRDGSELPVVSARFALWAQSPFTDDGPPAVIARRLNAMPAVGGDAAEHGFSWVTAHCWSWFRPASDDAPEKAEEMPQTGPREPTARRGLEPVAWCVRRLQPHVQVVTPTELTLLINLRLRPAQTLRRALAELEGACRTARPATKAAAMARIREARFRLERGDYRQAFQAGKEAARALSAVSPKDGTAAPGGRKL